MKTHFLKSGIKILAFALLSSFNIACSSDNDADDIPVIEDNKEASTRLATFNIRFDTSADVGVNAWDARKDNCIKTIYNNGFDVVGLQEVVSNQAEDMATECPNYTFFMVGRDDGTSGEQVGIAYKTSKYVLIDKGYFWLSPTPDVPSDSQAWGGPTRKRVAVWAKLRDGDTKKTFYFMTAHLEVTGGDNVRLQSIELINQRLNAINTEGYPVFVVGDMNANYTEESMTKMREYMADAFNEAEEKGLREGPISTYNAFNTSADMSQQANRIDFIYMKGDYELKKYKAIDDKFAGNYASDHIPVIVDVVIK